MTFITVLMDDLLIHILGQLNHPELCVWFYCDSLCLPLLTVLVKCRGVFCVGKGSVLENFTNYI